MPPFSHRVALQDATHGQWAAQRSWLFASSSLRSSWDSIPHDLHRRLSCTWCASCQVSSSARHTKAQFFSSASLRLLILSAQDTSIAYAHSGTCTAATQLVPCHVPWQHTNLRPETPCVLFPSYRGMDWVAGVCHSHWTGPSLGRYQRCAHVLCTYQHIRTLMHIMHSHMLCNVSYMYCHRRSSCLECAPRLLFVTHPRRIAERHFRALGTGGCCTRVGGASGEA